MQVENCIKGKEKGGGEEGNYFVFSTATEEQIRAAMGTQAQKPRRLKEAAEIHHRMPAQLLADSMLQRVRVAVGRNWKWELDV